MALGDCAGGMEAAERRSGMAPTPRAALVTGVGRRRSIGAGLAIGLAHDGWDLALGYWSPYDDRLGYERSPHDPQDVAEVCRELGSRVVLLPADLADPQAPGRLVATAVSGLGPLSALVMSHCESVDGSILTTSLDSWERHFAVNARATWLLVKAFAEQLPVGPVEAGEVQGRIVALTSDHTAHNLPYGASKGALDRIIVAAAVELADRGVRANAINPGPIDTGWMSDEIRTAGVSATPAGRLGTPADTAALVRFLLSDSGSWINGQVLYSNGGFNTG
jgi:3-oxoacyl-[acyl-carrier protein] reductase